MSAGAMCKDFEIRVATDEDCDRLLQFLRLHYYRDEPLTVGCEPPEPDQFDEEFLLSNVPHGTCLLLLHKERIVAAAVAGPKDSTEGAHLIAEIARLAGTKYGRILGILAKAETDSNTLERFNVDKAIHLHALGVDREFRGRAFGEQIVNALINRAKELGYPLITADCSSVYSCRLMTRLGFVVVNTIRYVDYVDEAGVQLLHPPAPHTTLDTVALRL